MIPEVLGRLAIWLMQADVGLGLAVLVGLSMSVSHLFALVANRLTPARSPFNWCSMAWCSRWPCYWGSCSTF